MTRRVASCSCGQLRVTVQGEPLRVGLCHCLACQRRTGSVFGVQARFGRAEVEVTGASRQYTRLADEDGEPRTSHFCPECGATVLLTDNSRSDTVGIPVGAFADPDFSAPAISVWEERMHSWVTLPHEVEHIP